jgi:predicted phosphodiesterase
MNRPEHTDLWILLADIHHPEYSKTAFKAAMNFLERNKEKIKGVALLGDNMNCENISRHTKGKPRLRTRGGIARDFARFNKDILLEIEKRIMPGTEKVFFLGNHEDWLEQWLDENPEFEGMVSFDRCLGLTKRGWEVIKQGGHRQIGKAFLVHGDQVGSGMHVAKKLVDNFCATAIMGHVHTASSYTKVSQVKSKDKWIGYTLPTLGTVSPKYAKGRPNAFVQGLGIAEVWKNDFINVYTPIILSGKFSFAGDIYSGV